MNKRSILFSLVLLLSFGFFTSCGKDAPEPTPKEKNTKLLTSSGYTITAVDKGGEAVTLDNATTITFNNSGTYTVTGSALPEPFPASGEWKFSDETNFDNILLTSGAESLEIDLTTFAEKSLIFAYDGEGVKPTDPPVTVTVTASR